MKTAKKAISIFLCALMLVTSFINEGWSSLITPPEASAMAGHEQNYNDTRVELDFNKNWSFGFTDDDSAYLKGYDDSAWERVDLPHDFSMSQEFTTEGTEAESGNLPGGTGWYRKWFNLYEYYSGDRVILNFDGAYQHVYVYVNGKYVGENHYGYNSFSFEIADYIICSNTVLNLIAVKVVNEVPSSRWYTGSGINRDVTLTIASPVHVSLYGPRITTPFINASDELTAVDGTINADIKLHNRSAIAKKVTVEASILDNNHNAVSGTVSSHEFTIDGDSETSVTLNPSINSPVLWSTDNPKLYILKTVVKDKNGELIDEYHTTFGYREISWDADTGFSLNGKPMKLKGVCLHHDQGALGAVQEYDALYRQLMILKDMGCNAIRTSHNSTSKILINICNEIGMLVIEEFFDGWDVSKDNNTYDFSKYFNETLTPENKAIGAKGQKWYEYVIEHTIYRDAHDPCVIAWDIGNELGNVDDIYSTGNYEEISTAIVNLCKELDPDRAVLHGNNSPINDKETYKVELLKAIDNKMDVIGGNYVPWNWQEVMNDSNDPRSSKPFVATESASALSNRGVYYTMGKDAENKQITAYDTHHVEWGNNAAEAWYYVAINDWFSGEFIWTGFDYIGEPTPWNDMENPNENSVPNSSYFGVVDTAGFEKDSYYLYRSLWNENDTTLHLVPGTWNSENLYLENGYVNVAVYSNAHRIELLLNGNVIATAASQVNTTEAGYTYRTWEESIVDDSACNINEFYTEFGRDFYSQFKVKFSAGNLSVKAYDKNGIEITDTKGTDKVVGGTATKIAVNTWNNLKTFTADGADFIYVEFEAQDENGNFINDYNGTVNVKVDDTSARYAKIVGVDNGNPATTDKFQQPSVLEKDGASAKIQMYNGKALVILKTTEEEGTINLTAVANDGYNSISTEGITVTSVKETGIQLTDELEEVIKQNGHKYEVTLYDEYEIVKHHINNLEPPVGGSSGDSDNSGNTDAPDSSEDPINPDAVSKFTLFNASTVENGIIPDGRYVIYNRENVLTGKYNGWSLVADNNLTDKISNSDTNKPYQSFYSTESNIFEFKYQGNNTYYIKNIAEENYFSIWKSNGAVSNTPQLYNIQIQPDGSVNIINQNNNYLAHYVDYTYGPCNYFCGEETGTGYDGTHADLKMWLYAPDMSTEVFPPIDEEADLYEIYLPEASETISGDYVIYNQQKVLANSTYYNYGSAYGITADDNLSDKTERINIGNYDYESFKVSADDVYTFIPTGNGTYYIQNKSTEKYYTINGLQDYPIAFSVNIYDDGSMNIVSEYGYYVVHYTASGANFAGDQPRADYPATDEDFVMWLYKPANLATDDPVTPPEDEEASTSMKEVCIYLPNSVSSEAYIPDGEYVVYNRNYVLANGQYDTWAVTADGNLSNKVTASDAAYDFESFETSTDNVYNFTNIGNNTYHIYNESTKLYFTPNGPRETPTAFKIQTYSDGSVNIYCDYAYVVHYINDAYFAGNTPKPDENYPKEHSDFRMWLYIPKAASASSEKRGLYDILFEGIEVDYSKYSRDSFEVLLRALEEGVSVYENPDSTDSDFAAATQNIRNAIDSLVIDIKKIDGTLFKYGYDNSSGTPDYKDGGILMNQISVEKMQNAILADENLMNQIKAIIHYDDPTYGWTDDYADKALEAAVNSYARIYSLLFTGKAVAGVENNNGAITVWPPINDSTNPPATLWNIWTKDNTHGENDTVLNNNGVLTPVHDGASVQGLAGSTLEKGVITSHAAYSGPLSYKNDGPTENDSEPYDVETHKMYVFTGSNYVNIELSYLSGISVYFPDVFTRESLDADGNVTNDTSGRFSKYYWDAKFPIFISTDPYGVNTYHFDSKDKQYLVQSTFDDANHKVEMELNEVGNWEISGTTAQSGFFPFNYNEGAELYPIENAIYHYGFTFEHNFYIPKGGKHLNGEDVIFNFSGDDDVYVYIDGVLVLDNGGLHGPREVTINFTDCTINYQYAMDVTEGKLKADGVEYGTTYSYNDYFKNPETCGYNADTIAALEKLHEIITDGQVHTLNFFYLERGSSDSNCKMSFNLSETSEDVRIIDQELTLDYGLPVEYDIKDNNDISPAAIANGVQIEYLGICAINEDVTSTYTFELPEIIVPFEKGKTYNVEGMKYGDCTIDKEGNVTYNLKSMNATESDHFYVCAKITGDPTYAGDVVYYQLERTTFIPATTIYYEDTYETITYTNGKVPAGYNNEVNKYGLWQEKGTQPTALKQSADLTDSEANPYGYEANYMSFAEFSAGSIHYVDVSTKNNPNKKFSGGEGAKWPEVNFTFTGTGFDLISITDNTTGAFSVKVVDEKTNTVAINTVVDTFYGYNYGQIFSDSNGKPSLDSTLTPMYRSEDGTCTSSKRYYDENGKITDVPHYYDGETVVDKETDNPSYAYAYGWVIAEEGTTETLYQIPVIKITDLEYGSYNVTITPTFTSAFGHSSVNSDGTNYYRVYLDAIKIYSPAGTDDSIKDPVVKDAYATDDELYPDYLELKDMLIGAESLSETEEQGIIFIDGIAALDNDLEKYKNAGPNNELYLAKDQAVAFEIRATSVPTDIQLGAKLACGNPELSISYDAHTTPVGIRTAHDTFYSLNTVLPNDAKLTWHLVTGADGNKYYTTGTVVIQNTGDSDSVLSVTNLKWTFSQNGGKGYFRIPTPVENETVSVTSSANTPRLAYSLMRMRTADLDIEQTEIPEVKTSEDGSSLVSIKLNTSSEVDSLIITDSEGNVITPAAVEKIATELDGREAVEWLVTLKENAPGIHIYTIAGAYANGYVDDTRILSVTVTIEEPETDEPGQNIPEDDSSDDDSNNSVFDSITGFFNRIIEFFKALLALFGISF